eukprot:TRINITY_DN7612_c0_g1_i1.p1 TRINITY_DN7612_c0_g1~~TRINITY_DN7612_c0_g1_i1.p1  ORF type:complete len:308 (+),score=48.00 TRINITY_DN7612_c0_g1_i1:184-1107(+)
MAYLWSTPRGAHLPLIPILIALLSLPPTSLGSLSSSLSSGGGGDPIGGVEPPHRDGLFLWFAADDLSSQANGSRVSRWRDKVSGRNAFPTRLAPVVVHNALNGLSVVRFNGRGQKLTFSQKVNGLNELTLFVVSSYSGKGCADWQKLKVDPMNGDVDPLLYWDEKGDWGGVGVLPGDRTVISRFGLGPLHGSGENINRFTRPRPLPLGVHSLTAFRKTFSKEELFVEGSLVWQQEVGRSDAIVNTGPTLSLGGGGIQGSSCWNGDLAEVMAYNASLSDQQRLAVEVYLANRWMDGLCGPASQLALIC